MKFFRWLRRFVNESILLIDEPTKRDPEDAARGPYAFDKDPELVSKLVSRPCSYRVPDYVKPVPPAAASLRTVFQHGQPIGANKVEDCDFSGNNSGPGVNLVADRVPSLDDAEKVVKPYDFGPMKVKNVAGLPLVEDASQAPVKPVEAALAAHDAARAAGAEPEAALDAAKAAATKARAKAPNPVSKSPVAKAAPKAAKKSKAAPVVKKTTPAAPSGKKPSKRS